MSYTIGFISDIHAGSHCAGWPEGWLGPELPFTATRYVNECLAHAAKNCPNLDLLVLNGDLIDGRQKKSDSTGLHEVSLKRQVEGAVEILRPFVEKSKKVVRTEGTPYHEDFHEALGLLDEKLGVSTVQQVLNIDLGNGILNVAHHPPGGSVLYQGTKLDRMILWNIIQAACKQFPDAKWIVRSHMHEWSEMRRKGRTAIITPPWQLPTPWAKKQNRESFTSDIGFVLMREDPDMADGWKFIEKLYSPPIEAVLTPEAL